MQEQGKEKKEKEVKIKIELRERGREGGRKEGREREVKIDRHQQYCRQLFSSAYHPYRQVIIPLPFFPYSSAPYNVSFLENPSSSYLTLKGVFKSYLCTAAHH